MAAATGSLSSSSRQRWRAVRMSGTVARIIWCIVIIHLGYSSRSCGWLTMALVDAPSSGRTCSMYCRSRRLLLIVFIGNTPRSSSSGRPFFHHVRADHQGVQRRSPEALQRIARRADDGIAARVERGVDEHGDPGAGLKRLEQIVIARRLLAVDRLDAGRAIHVAHCWDAPRL